MTPANEFMTGKFSQLSSPPENGLLHWNNKFSRSARREAENTISALVQLRCEQLVSSNVIWSWTASCFTRFHHWELCTFFHSFWRSLFCISTKSNAIEHYASNYARCWKHWASPLEKWTESSTLVVNWSSLKVFYSSAGFEWKSHLEILKNLKCEVETWNQKTFALTLIEMENFLCKSLHNDLSAHSKVKVSCVISRKIFSNLECSFEVLCKHSVQWDCFWK